MKLIHSEAAPKAVGPYSHGVVINGFLYTSGMIALDPATGNLVEGDFAAQARRVFDNLAAILDESGSDFSRVVKATVYVTDLANFQTLNTLYAERFGAHKPARTTVEVPNLPKGAAVEIDLVALV